MTIKVLLVEDSKISLVILRRILNEFPQMEVVGEAPNGLEALRLIPKVQPDVICTDLHMPQMDGLEFTTEVMSHYPKPILVLSVSVQHEDTHHIFDVLEAGAVDICPKPIAGLTMGNQAFNRELINKIIVLSGVRVFKKKPKPLVKPKPINLQDLTFAPATSYPKPKIIAIGTSTGGPPALQEILSQLPANFSVPIICVQHICQGFLQGLIDWLSATCKLPIKIAKSGYKPQPGIIYFPPEQHHLELNNQGDFVCSDKPALDGHRPSVTVTFESVAKVYGKKSTAILLTGMGRDGAKGMLAIAQAGGLTIAQDEATSIIFGMPKEAIDLGAAREVLPLGAIAPMLLELLQKQSIVQ
ncbi:MAG: chemotaxis-specific protein-glutamate methyltransferase CheB [Coleofasciculus sp. G1-WW12-02]|uniref:chemotaxis-specific protein-glutamate methyltransferase CheB n=1 Tax=Coleofasciculus sp. G1-WW12-02 TaxID=3068483 RepID=UPI0032F2C543